MKNYIDNRGFVSTVNSDGTTTLYINCNTVMTGSFMISGSIVSGSSTIKQVSGPKIVVGIATAGDTLNDCHYLDAGDGVQLNAALVAAGAQSPDADVWLRNGIINLTSGPIAVPSLVTLRCSGLGNSIRPSATDRRALTVGAGGRVFDARFDVPVPSAGATGEALISISAEAMVHNSFVIFSAQSAGQKANESLRYVIQSSSTRAQIINPVIYGISFEASSLTQSLTAIQVVGANLTYPSVVINPTVLTTDIGLDILGPAKVENIALRGIARKGITGSSVAATQRAFHVMGGEINMAPASEACFGIDVNTGANGTGLFAPTFTNINIERTGAANTGSIGIRITGSGVAASVVQCSVDAFATGITSSATQTNGMYTNNIVRGFTGVQHILVQSSGSTVANNNII